MIIKKQEGITLTVLVITIVVMLIIAGSTLTMIFDKEGMLKSSAESKELQENYSNREEGKTNELIDNVDELMQTEVEKGKLVPIDKKCGGYADSTSEDKVPVPGGYCVVKDSVKNPENKNTIESGLVISDLVGDTLDNEEITVNGEKKRGNQFVWVPVPDASVIYGVDEAGVKHGKLYIFGEYDNSSSKYTTYIEPKLINWTEGKGVISTTSNCEPEIITDYDGPDASYSQDFTTAISQTMTAEQFKEQLQGEFDSMIESVKKYGGFYIGRYETQGMTSTISEDQKIEDVKLTVKKGIMPSTNINWYYMYQESKNIGKNNKNVTSSMIWGCQWDRTMDWIAQASKKTDGSPDYSLLTDSSSWGNYSNYSEVTNDKSIPNISIQESGTNTNWQKNHIYDLAGNVYEWVLEACGNLRPCLSRWCILQFRLYLSSFWPWL